MSKFNESQSAKAVNSANENNEVTEVYIDKAILKSMKWIVNGKGVVVTITDLFGNILDERVWVEKSIENGLIYKFCVERKGKTYSIEVNSATWSDYDLFNGNMLKNVTMELYRLINEDVLKG